METIKYQGELVISDELLLGTDKSLKFSHSMVIRDNLELEAIDFDDEGYLMTYVKIHVYDKIKKMDFDLLKGELHHEKGLKYTDKRLVCDMASFNIYTNQGGFKVVTGADGYYGDVIECDGETIISLYFESHFVNAETFVEKFKNITK